MQEQLPLSPAEFVKIRDGFIAFLKQPAGTPIELIIPKEVLDAMALAAHRGRRRQLVLDVMRGISIVAVAVGAALAVFREPMAIGVAVLLTSGVAFVWAHNKSKIRFEPEIDELVTEPNVVLQRNLRALGSRLNHSQKATAAARLTAERKFLASLS